MFALLAQIDLETAVKLNPTDTEGVGTVYPTVASFLNLLVPTLFILSGFVLLFLLIGGGFSIIASGGNAKSVEGGKKQMTSAVLGFLVMFAAYWIIQIVEIVTGIPILQGTGF